MQCPLLLSQMETMTLNSNKEMMPRHFTIINKDLEYDLTFDKLYNTSHRMPLISIHAPRCP